MRKLFLATVSIATVFSLAVAARTISSPTPTAAKVQLAQSPNCNNPQTQSEMNICAGIEYQNADRKLNQTYQQLLPKLSPARKQKLVAAQQAWIKFKNASCDFEKSAFEGGTIAPMIYGNCLTKVTQQRTTDLESYLEDSNR